MLRKKTGCLTKGITVLASDTDLEASKTKMQQKMNICLKDNICTLFRQQNR